MDSVVDQFVATVREFTALIENLPSYDRDTFLDRCLILLPRLLSLGTEMPEQSGPDGEGDYLADEVPDWRRDGEWPSKLTHEWIYQQYSFMFDPVKGGEPDQYAFYLDLSEIYHDLKRCLIAYDSGDPEAQKDALWNWKFNFTWGWHTAHHIVNLIGGIFTARYFY